MKKILAIIAIAVMAVTMLASCGGEKEVVSSKPVINATPVIEDEPIEIEEIGEASVKKAEPDLGADPSKATRVISFSLTDEVIQLHIGKKGTIKYTMMPEKPTDPSIYWESANTDYVKVDKDGNIVGLKAGVTTVSGETNDGHYTKKVTVIITENEGNTEKTNEMIALINNYRKENKLGELKADNLKLNAMANHRIYEEAIEVLKSSGKQTPDDKRPDGSEHATVYKQFDLSWVRAIASNGYVYNANMDAQKAFDAIIKNEEAAIKAATDDAPYTNPMLGEYESIAVGYYEKNGNCFWTVWFVTE